MNRRIIIPIVVIPVALAAILMSSMAMNASNIDNNRENNTAQAIGGNPCPPTSLDEITVTSVPVKEPKSLPSGYTLQAVTDEQPTDIQLLYADHSLCEFPGGFDYHGHQLRIVAVKSEEYLTDEEYQKRWLDYAADPDNEVVTKIEPIEVNGHKGAGWEAYDGYSTVRLNETMIEKEPYHGDAALFFFNEEEQMSYSIFANNSDLSLQQLTDVAKSIE